MESQRERGTSETAREREREREREKEKHSLVAPCTYLDLGLNLQALGVWDNASTKPPSQGAKVNFKGSGKGEERFQVRI